MPDQDPIGPTPGRWQPHPPYQSVTDPPPDRLAPAQRERAAAAYEAARMILGEDPPADDVIAVASWIVTGRGVTNIKVMPSEDLIQQVIARVSQSVQTGIDNVVGDSVRYRPPLGGDEIGLTDQPDTPKEV